MTRDSINEWIARYTVSNANYMRNGVDNGNYNCYAGEGNSYLFRTNLGIPSGEAILSFLDIGILSSGEKGLAFTENGVYGRDRFGDRYHFNYCDYSSFNVTCGGFDNYNVRDIMHDIYEQIEEYNAEQYRIEKRNNNIKKIATGGGVIGGIAAILAGLSAANEISKQQSDTLEENVIGDILDDLSDLFN